MSRVDFGVKPVMYPMPVLIIGTYDENGVPNAMNAAWGMITDRNEISISMSEHKTTENIAKIKKINASIMVSIVLDLSIGTTLFTSPS